MNSKKNIIAFSVATLFTFTGIYNSVVINSESSISGADYKFVKRLDEIYGVTVPGRDVAASVSWKKVKPAPVAEQVEQAPVRQVVSTVASAPSVEASNPPQEMAAVQEDLNLALVEVTNTNKWKNGLTATQFSGGLTANNGVIEDLNVSLPNGEGVSVSFSEMTGNVFEYDLDGELYSGMMYQVDQTSYMVTLTNGPLEGTRLRFSAQAPVDQQQVTQEVVAENNVDNGQGQGNQELPVENQQQMHVNQENQMQNQEQLQVNQEALQQNDQQLQQEGVQAQSFNM